MEPQIKELTSISSILHLVHHRNSNQHRLSKWYKAFSQLRRQIPKLAIEIQSLDTALKYTDGGVAWKENKYVKAAREKMELRIEFLEERLMGRCYL